MALFNEERQLRPLLNAIGREDLPDDPRFATKEARKQNAAALVVELDAAFATRDMAEWRKILDAVGVTFGVVGRIDDVADDAQMQAIGALVPFADGKTLTVSSPFHLDGETKVAPRRAPTVGQHSEDCCAMRATRPMILGGCASWACWRSPNTGDQQCNRLSQ
jgi:crotonobetainyl-CoA:carnitine CoA-transferase CaiB-like acyl-CoA transferase